MKILGADIVNGGQLVFIDKDDKIYEYTKPNGKYVITKITNSDVSVKTESGDEITVKFNQHNCVRSNIRYLAKKVIFEISSYEYIYIHHGFLKFFFNHVYYVVMSKLMFMINDAAYTNDKKILVQFKDGRICKCTVKDNNLLTEFGDAYPLYPTDSHQAHYSKYGKLEPENIFLMRIMDRKIWVQTTGGDIYLFNRGCISAIEEISRFKLYVSEKSSLLKGLDFTMLGPRRLNVKVADVHKIYELVAISDLGIPYVVESRKLLNYSNIVELFQDGNEITMKTSLGEIIKTSLHAEMSKPLISASRLFAEPVIVYYSDELGNLYNIKGNELLQLNERYLTPEMELVNNISDHLFPATNCLIEGIYNVYNYNGIFVINERYAILNKFESEIECVTFGEDFDIYSLVMTFKNGIVRRFCVGILEDDMPVLVFKDGEILDCILTDKTNLAEVCFKLVADYKKINDRLYEINGNTVFFHEAKGDIKIYEYFGNYIAKSERLYCGKIIINRRASHTKAALK